MINWSSSLEKLGPKSKTIQELIKSGYKTLEDLLYIFPLHTKIIPRFSTFNMIAINEYFRGVGKIIGVQERGSFKAKGKGGAKLINIVATVQDAYSPAVISLKWFNLYPSQATKIKKMNLFTFQGEVSEYLGQAQVVSPNFSPLEDGPLPDLSNWSQEEEVLVQYPTVNGVSPHHLKQVFKKIPHDLWNEINEPLPHQIIRNRTLLTLGSSLKILHGKCPLHELTNSNREQAHKRILYDQFLENQIKVQIRKDYLQKLNGININIKQKEIDEVCDHFSYELTEDQKKSLSEIIDDFKRGYPMMRLLQGDVGSGKTTVAFASAAQIAARGFQVALMCPTESLANQHYQNFKKLFPKVAIELLTSSTKAKTRKGILEDLTLGRISIIFGTHSLIQDDVIFKNLAYVIIDEQHKFGVEQRIKLTSKNTKAHCLLMTATPIPRSLRLAQYGDLEVSTIKEMPSNRKGINTRIVTPNNYAKYLSFIKTRLSMGEQVYIVVAAIEESKQQDINHIHAVYEQYCSFFPECKIEFLHGQMKNEEKSGVLERFYDNNIQLLISTSVIEVGIDNPQATIMAVLNPERFGLSSLHQLRGRVGRGQKPGFCFLVNDKDISQTLMERLKVIENHTDGFLISEEDLRLRGEGDLFGKSQSGLNQIKVRSHEYSEILNWANQDVVSLKEQAPITYQHLQEKYISSLYITKTI